MGQIWGATHRVSLDSLWKSIRGILYAIVPSVDVYVRYRSHCEINESRINTVSLATFRRTPRPVGDGSLRNQTAFTLIEKDRLWQLNLLTFVFPSLPHNQR
jgi:hypothetical protein